MGELNGDVQPGIRKSCLKDGRVLDLKRSGLSFVSLLLKRPRWRLSDNWAVAVWAPVQEKNESPNSSGKTKPNQTKPKWMWTHCVRITASHFKVSKTFWFFDNGVDVGGLLIDNVPVRESRKGLVRTYVLCQMRSMSTDVVCCKPVHKIAHVARLLLWEGEGLGFMGL